MPRWRRLFSVTSLMWLRDDDLPGYASHLFDYLMAHPETVRMVARRRLERPHADPRLAAWPFPYTHAAVNGMDASPPTAGLAVPLHPLTCGPAVRAEERP